MLNLPGRRLIKRYWKPWENRLLRGDPDIDPVEYLVLEDRKAAFLVISKVACTSLKATIGRSYGIGFEKQSGLDIHRHPAWHREWRRLPRRYADFFTFAFVRNPFSRLVSCWKDRVLFAGGNEDFRHYYFRRYPIDIPPNSAFADFVRRIVRIPDGLADRHFKRQSYSLFRNGRVRPPDFIGKMERLDEDWATVAGRLGLEPVVERLNDGNRHGPAAKADYRDLYDGPTLRLVADHFRDDVELLGYQAELAALHEHVARSGT